MRARALGEEGGANETVNGMAPCFYFLGYSTGNNDSDSILTDTEADDACLLISDHLFCRPHSLRHGIAFLPLQRSCSLGKFTICRQPVTRRGAGQLDTACSLTSRNRSFDVPSPKGGCDGCFGRGCRRFWQAQSYTCTRVPPTLHPPCPQPPVCVCVCDGVYVCA